MPRQLYQIWNREKTRKFQEKLLDWYAQHKRELPWRDRPEPYRVWISEVMLQQTQVRTVLSYYERFLKRFPDVERLAQAPEREVLESWSGLGYYHRARNLHRAAKIIVENHRGIFPDTLEAIAELPGVGRYTAGAILSIAFDRPQPIVDGNVRRVISRLHGIEQHAEDRFFWEQARAWIPEGRASEINQAVMELGALICTPSRPLCPTCPVRSLCEARRRGIQNQIPPRRAMRATESVQLVMLVLQKSGCVLTARARDAAYIPGEWGLPTRILRDGDAPDKAARNFVRELIGRSLALEPCSPVRHSITYRQVLIHVFRGKVERSAPSPAERNKLRWATRSNLRRLLTSSVFHKAIHSAFTDKTPGHSDAKKHLFV